MRTKLLSLEEAQNFLGDRQEEKSGSNTQRRQLQAARAVLQTAIERDLTGRQRQCIQLYFFQGLTMEAIGQQLGVGKSTVYRHLQRGKKRLERAFAYAAALQAGIADPQEDD